MLSIVLLFFFFHRLAVGTADAYGVETGMAFLLGSITVVRYVSYKLNFPFDFSRLPLFDPSVYASNMFHPSLGDLLVNSILFFWLAGFWKFQAKAGAARAVRKKWTLYLSIGGLTLLAFGIIGLMGSLVRDSRISFDVTNFFSLDIYSVTGFVTLCFLMLAWYHLSHIIMGPVFGAGIPLVAQVLTIVIAGFSFISVFGRGGFWANMMMIVWLSCYCAILKFRQKDMAVSLKSSSIFIIWILFFAMSATFLIGYENNQAETGKMKKSAERLALQDGSGSGNALAIAMAGIDQKRLRASVTGLASPDRNKLVKDSIINSNFIGFLNRFETSIYTFDHLFRPLHNEDSAYRYADLVSLRDVYGKPTSMQGLYSYQGLDGEANYLYSFDVCTETEPEVFFFVVARPKKMRGEALYPALFNQDGNGIEGVGGSGSKYEHAVYSGGRLIHKAGSHSFPLAAHLPKLEPYTFWEIQADGYKEIWYNGNGGKYVALAKANSWTIETITLFAYIFFTFLVVIGVFQVANFIGAARNDRKGIKKQIFPNIQSQIHVTVISVSLFSFVVIGSAIIKLTSDRFNELNKGRLFTTLEMVANEISTLSAPMDNALLGAGFEKLLASISARHGIDLNYYGLSGNLLASTQPHIYNKQLLGRNMDPAAYLALNDGQRNQFMQSERIGELSYLSIYMPLTDADGKVYAYLNLPFLNSQIELNKEISGFIATIINLNAFIFLIGGAIAFLITKRAVASFGVVATKMRGVGIGKKNEAIVWDKEDEIGVLVKEYNRMVAKLEESAEALAKSEREGAWREMARQVAHEIKNPLTPMKLSIQYLLKAMEANDEHGKTLARKMTASLVGQIDELAKIAGDFSQFANIGTAVLEEVHLTERIEGIARLFAQPDKVEVSVRSFLTAPIWADKVQIGRLFTNLIKNAIEACGDKAPCTVHIDIAEKDGNALVVVKDNGNGIPANVRPHIFQPNFTTKNLGTGLGLAICKGIVDKSGGQIWFETREGEGTAFFVLLPLKSN